MTAPATDNAVAQTLKVVVLRALRLDAVGALVTGADAMYVTSQPITFQYTPKSLARERLEQPNGNGDQCGLFIGTPKAVTDVDLKATFCKMDAELEELLCGGSIITDANYGTIGYRPPEDSTVNAYGTAIEVWSVAWNGKQPKKLGNSRAYWRHVFPLTDWSRDQVSLQNQFDNPSFTGSGQVNSGFGTGLNADQIPSTIGDVPYEWYLDDAKPTGQDGYQAVS